jgi:hypothetical protein
MAKSLELELIIKQKKQLLNPAGWTARRQAQIRLKTNRIASKRLCSSTLKAMLAYHNK